MRRLTAYEVATIRQLHSSGERQCVLAKRFGLDSARVSRIVHKLTHKELPQSFLEAFWGQIEQRGVDECWPWKGAVVHSSAGDYGHVGLLGMSTTAHRIAWEVTNGKEIPAGMFGCHTCDNPICCNPAHVFPGTQQDNMADAAHKGRTNHVPSYGRRLLTNEQVAQIRYEYDLLAKRYGARTAFYNAKAQQFGVSARTIRKVTDRETWLTTH